MADDRTIRVRLLAEVNSYVAGMKQAAGATADFGKNISGHGKAVRKDIEQVGRGALLMAAGMTVALGAAAKAAIDWEQAWAGVTKTVDATANTSLAQLEDGLRGLATTLPSTHKEIAAVAEAAGQLGVGADAIVGFTKTMVDLGQTTNLSADEAATSIAQMANIMGTDLRTEVDNFGATLVALGNAGASTEAEIMAMALRLAGTGKLIGASEADVLAMANAMASMGIQAELGGGAMSRVLLKMYSAVEDGGEKLDDFAEIAGSSGDEFAAQFGGKPLDALDAFLKGLTRIEGAGGNVIAALKEVGFKGVQDLQVLLRLKGAGDLLADSVELGSQAWMENTALLNEANKRYETAGSRLKVLKNQVTDVAIQVGDKFLPAIKGATSGLGTLVSGMGAMDGTSKTVVTGLAGVTAAVTGIVGIVGTVGPKFKAFQDSLNNMGTGGAFLSRNLGKITGALAGVGTALAIYTYIVGKNAQEQAEAEARTRGLTDAIIEQGSAVGEATDRANLEAVLAGDVGKALRDAGTGMDVFLDAMNLSGPTAKDLRGDLSALAESLRQNSTEMLAGEDAFHDFLGELDNGRLDSVPGLRDSLRELAGSGDLNAESMGRLLDRLREQNGSMQDAAVDAKNLTTAEEEAAAAADANATATERAKKALEQQAAAAEAAAEAIQDLIDAEHAAIDPLFAMLDATRGNAEANQALADAKNANADADAENNVSLEEMAALQQAAAESALDLNGAAISLAGSIAAGTVDLELAKSMLGEWVAQGLISQETADAMAVQFDAANEKAKLLAEDKVGSITVDVIDKINPFLDGLGARLAGIQRAIYIDVTARGRGPLAPEARGLAGGGPVGYRMPRARAADTIPMLGAPGEFMMQKSAVDRFGIRAMSAINAGQIPGGMGAPAPRAMSGGRSTTEMTITLPVMIDGKQMGQAIKKQVRIDGGPDRYFG